MTKKVNEDGGAGGAVNSAGTGGYSNAASAAGPVAGFDPVMNMKKRIKKQITRAKPPGKPGESLVGDNV